MSPFNEARYKRLLKGLDATEVPLSGLERTQRVDAEFFSKRHLRVAALMAKASTECVPNVADVSDGNHFTISNDFSDEGVPYYRGQDVVGNVFIEQSTPRLITNRAYQADHMKRSHLEKGDVLLSIVGTIGEASLVTTSVPATCSCKLAILRPKSVPSEYLLAFLRSEMGRSQTERLTRGAVQMGLLLEDMDQLFVARHSAGFEGAIVSTVQEGHRKFKDASALVEKAEATLFEVLDLANWRAPEPLTYTRPASEAFAEGRLDAEFHRPKVDALRQVLRRRFEVKQLSELGGEIENGQGVSYDERGDVPIIRSGDLSDMEDDARFLRTQRGTAIYKLERGDVLVSSIGFGSIGKIQVFDKAGTYGTVSEVTVIRQKEVNPYFLTSFLRSQFGQMQIDRYITGATGQLHLYKRDVRKIFIPIIPGDVQEKFENLARAAAKSRAQARARLAQAKRAVEIAIEESEAAALKYLQKMS